MTFEQVKTKLSMEVDPTGWKASLSDRWKTGKMQYKCGQVNPGASYTSALKVCASEQECTAQFLASGMQ